MRVSDLISLVIFLTVAHHSHARPQEPPAGQPDDASCLTTVFLNRRDILVATPGPKDAVLEVRTIKFADSSTLTSVIATSTLVQNAPAITPLAPYAIALNGAGNLVLDGNEWVFDHEISCPRMIIPYPESPIDAIPSNVPTYEKCFPPCEADIPCPRPQPTGLEDPCMYYFYPTPTTAPGALGEPL